MQRLLILIAVLALGAAIYFLAASSESRGDVPEESAREEARSKPEAAPAGAATKTALAPAPLADEEEHSRAPLATRETLEDPASESVRVQARVLDAESRPVADVPVYAVRYPVDSDEAWAQARVTQLFELMEGQYVEGIPVSSAASDQSGHVAFEVPADFSYLFVFARKPGWQFAISQKRLKAGPAVHDAGDLLLEPAVTLDLRIEDAKGNAIPHAMIGLANDTRSRTTMPFYFKRSDDRGRGLIAHLAPGDWQLEVEAADYVPAQESLELQPDAEPLVHRVVLQAGAEVSGIVRYADGSPAADVDLSYALHRDGDQPRERTRRPFQFLQERDTWAKTDAEGRFRGGGLRPEAHYVLTAEKGRHIRAQSDLVQPGQEVEIRFDRTGGLSGLIVAANDHRPLAGAEVRVFAVVAEDRDRRNYERRYQGEAVTSDEKGRFEFQLPRGRYRLAVRHETGELALDEGFEFEGALDLGHLEVPIGGEVLVRLRDAETDRPVPTVRIRASGSGRRRSRESAAQLYLDNDRKWEEIEPGSYLSRGVPAGTLELRTYFDGYLPLNFEVESVPGQRMESTQLLSPAMSLTVRARYPDGTPAKGRHLILRLAQNLSVDETQSRRRVQELVNASGVASFTNLAPGDYELFANHGQPWDFDEKSPPLAYVNVGVNNEPLEVTLPAPFYLTVEVIDRNGAPIPEAGVWHMPDGGRRRMRFDAHDPELLTDSSGHVDIQALSPGTHWVAAARKGGHAVWEQVELHGSGQVVRLQLQGMRVRGRVIGVEGNVRVSLHRQLSREERDRWHSELREGHRRPSTAAMMQLSYRHRVQCEPDGSFQFVDVPSGEYDVVASVAGYYADDETATRITVEDGDIDGLVIELKREAKLILRVTGLRGDARTMFLTRVADDTGRDRTSEWFYDNGDHEIRGLAPGSYTMRIYAVDSNSLGRDEDQALAEFSVSIDVGRDTIVEWRAN